MWRILTAIAVIGLGGCASQSDYRAQCLQTMPKTMTWTFGISRYKVKLPKALNQEANELVIEFLKSPSVWVVYPNTEYKILHNATLEGTGIDSHGEEVSILFLDFGDRIDIKGHGSYGRQPNLAAKFEAFYDACRKVIPVDENENQELK